MSHPNEDLARRGYAAFGSGDMDTIRELFDPDIVWHAPGRNQLSGDVHGLDNVLAQFAKVFELTGGSFKLELHDLLANDDHVVGLVRATADHDGRHLDDNSVQLLHVREGKVTESWLYPGDQYATDEFWG
jgi:ketosteroid isomerase-like protein